MSVSQYQSFPCSRITHILICMPLPNEVQQLIRSTITAKDDELIREMNVERRDIGAQLAVKGLAYSSVRAHQDIDAIERFIHKRMTAYVDIYLHTLAELGIKIDVELEAEIVHRLEGLASGRHGASPPGITMMTNHSSVRELYKSRLGKADMEALSSGKNRVRMARLKDSLPPKDPQLPVVNHYTAQGPNARVSVGSTDNSSNMVQTDVRPSSAVEPQKKKWSLGDGLAVALACLSGVMALVLVWMEKTPVWAGMTIGGMAVLMIYPVLHFIRPWMIRIPALIAIWGIIALFGWKIWPRPVTPLTQPVVKNVPASPQPTITVPAPQHRAKSPRLTIVQSSASGATEVLITAEERFPHPVFRVLCSAPCTLGQSGAVSLAYRAGAPNASDDSTVITVPIEIPGQIDAGQQIYLDLLPKGDSPVSILSVNGYPVMPPSRQK